MAVLFGGWATAATYTLPDGTLPTGCTKGSSTSVTCSSLSLAWADAVVVSNANLMLTVGATLTFGGGNNINTSNTVSGFTIKAKDIMGSNVITLKGKVTATNDIKLTSNTNSITGNLDAGNDIEIGGVINGILVAGDDVKTQYATKLTGSVTAGGKFESGGGSTYGGNVTADDDIKSGSSDIFSGDVASTDGKVTLASTGTTVAGNVSAKDEVKLESGTKVAGSVTSSNDAVTLASSGTTVGNGVTAKKAVILGSSCTVTGDVVTDDTVTLQSSGSQVIGNIFAKKKVTLGSSTSVTGNVTTINSDVELNSSNASVSGCVTVDSNQTLKLGWSTSAGGVCCLSGGVCSATGCVTNNSGNAAPSACAAASATLIAQWHFEEATAYTGTAGELLDSAGYTGGPFNGVAIGNPLPAVNPASPARTGNPGTCSYGTAPGPVANGGAFSVSGLPVSLAAGAKTSVAFWMYWDGTNGVMPIGWNLHDLWLADGYLGFNTGNNDLFGLASTGLANGWHHVVAVFTNGSVSGNQLYIDGVSQTLSKQRSNSPSLPDAKVSTNLRIGGWAVNTGYRFSGRIDEVKLYNGALTQAQVSADFAETHACQASVICVVDSFATGTLNPALWNVAAVSGSFVPSVVDVSGAKRLRLTQAAGNQSTMTQLKKWYPGAGNKIVVEFDYYDYGGNGADGVTVVFSDASQSPSAGGFGGSLGYAQRSGINGFGGGWLGVGLDEFGNFPTTGEGRTGYPAGYTAPTGANVATGFYKNNISVRGSGSGTTGYPLLANTGTLATPIWKSTNTASTVQRFRIIIDHSDAIHAYVSVERDLSGSGSSYTTLVAPFDAKASSTQAAVPANWLVSFTGSTGGSYNIHELTNLSICATFVTDPSGSVNAAGFDCLETGQNNPWNVTARRPLFTKLAGTGFGFDVVALKTDGSLEGDYVVSGGDTRYVKVDLYDDASAPACTAVTPLASPSAVVAFKSGAMVAGGRTNKTASDTLFSLTVPTAYKKLRCRVRECTDATCTGFTSLAPACSSDQFAVRPAAFLVTQNTPTLNAGSSFTLQAAAVNSNLTSTSTNYTGTPLLDRAQITGVPGFTSAALWGDLPAATAGISYATFTYDDVGSFTLPATSPGTYGVSDSTFTSVDASADCIVGSASNAVVASGVNKGKYGCLIGQSAALTVGTFVPDHFEISDKAFSAGCTGGGFTYMDQPFTLGYKVTAKSMSRASPAVNSPGNVALMLYTGGKLNHAVINGSTDGLSKISLAASMPATPAFTNPLIPAWSNGSYSQPVTAYKFIRPTSGAVDASWGPFDALNIGVAIDDPSGAGYITGTKTFSFTRATSAACVTSGECKDFASLTTGDLPTKFRFGRLRLQNAYGSELLALPVPLEAQYWAGNYYLTNTADSCTVLPMASITMGNYLKQLSACKTQLTPTGNVALVAGKLPGTGLVLTKPGAGNAGSVDLAINVSATATGNTCVGATQSGASAANMPWFGPNVGARATFGIYKSPLIYRRENY